MRFVVHVVVRTALLLGGPGVCVRAAQSAFGKSVKLPTPPSHPAQRVQPLQRPPLVDFSAGAGQLSAPARAPPQKPPRFWGVQFARQVQRRVIPALPTPWLVAITCASGGELVKREAVSQVNTNVPQELRPEALALLEDTYIHVQARAIELQESNWDWRAIALKEAAEWRKRSRRNPKESPSDDFYSRWESLLRAALEARASELLSDWSNGSVTGVTTDFKFRMGQHSILEATFRQLEESVGRLLPSDTQKQLQRIELLMRQLDRPGGLGDLGVVELYEALSNGAPPPPGLMDVARLLSISNATAYSLGSLEAAGDRHITLASLLVKLTSPSDVTRALVYTALAAESEAVENLRTLNEGLQAQIARALADTEAELLQNARAKATPMMLDTGPYGPYERFNYTARARNAAVSGVRATRSWFSKTTAGVNEALEELVEPTRRGLPKPGQLLPWQRWYQYAWNSVPWTGSTANNATQHEAPLQAMETTSEASSAALPPSAAEHVDEDRQEAPAKMLFGREKAGERSRVRLFSWIRRGSR